MSPDLLKSKKFFVAILASALAFYGVLNEFTPEQLIAVVGPLMVYVGGQGLADFGKEASKYVAKLNSTFSAGGAKDEKRQS